MPRLYARIDAGVVTEIVTINDGELPLSARYHAALLDNFVELQGPEQFTIKLGWNYDGSGFSEPARPIPPPAKRYVRIYLVRERMEAAGKWENLVAIMQNDMAKLVKVLTLEIGVDVEDQEVRQIIAMAGADPDEILRE